MQRVRKKIAIIAIAGVVLVSIPFLSILSFDLASIVAPKNEIKDAVLVYVNESTLEELPSQNGVLDRRQYVRLLDRLTKDGAQMVFLDVLFAESGSPDVDKSLAEAITNHGSVILASSLERINEEGAAGWSPILPVEPMRSAALGYGHILLEDPARQISRRIAQESYAGWEAVDRMFPGKLAQENPKKKRWLNYYGLFDTSAIRHEYFHDAVTNRLSAEVFKNKYVFVGQQVTVSGYAGRKDLFQTPHTRFTGEHSPGVAIHAAAFLNLSRGDWMTMAPLFMQWILVVAWATVCVVLLEKVGPKGPLLVGLSALTMACALIAISLIIQQVWHVWWGWFGPAFGQTFLAAWMVAQAPLKDPYLAFISYRVEDDGAAALLIQRSLQDRGQKTFIDVKSLSAGLFDEQLLREIESSTFFILILSPRSLARCVNPDDWVLREIRHAFAHKKTVIPVFKGGFKFEAEGVPDLPEIRQLSHYQGVVYSNSDFDGFMEKLIQTMKAEKSGVV